MTFITFPRKQTEKLNKNPASPQFTNQLNKTSQVENSFKDTVDLRECPSKTFFTRAIRSATKLYNNEKDVKCAIPKKNVSF